MVDSRPSYDSPNTLAGASSPYLPAVGNHAKRKGLGERMAYGLAEQLDPIALHQLLQYAGLSDGLFSNWDDVLKSMNPAAQNAEADRNAQYLQGQGREQGLNLSSMLRAQGASSGTQMGALVNSANNATRLSNQNRMDVFSPERKAGLLGAAKQGIQPDAITHFLNALSTGVYGRPGGEEAQGGGLAGTLGQVAGLFSGGLPGALMGGLSKVKKIPDTTTMAGMPGWAMNFVH